MSRCIVTASKLNRRKSVPASLSDKTNIAGTVTKGFTFDANEVTGVRDTNLGKWYRDKDSFYYWGGGIAILDEPVVNDGLADNTAMDSFTITPLIKRKIEQVINVFETGSAEGNYSALVKYADYSDPETKTKIVQVTFGRSQTTEFGNLRALVQDYVVHNGTFADQLMPYIDRIGKKPSLATDLVFCQVLKDAGKTDPIMKTSQDSLFDSKYYQPAHSWFSVNGFSLPLSLLVIYDSYIHSGSIPAFLRKRFSTAVPSSGGSEQEWIGNYINTRHDWLANHSSDLLRKTVYRTECFKAQIKNDNWDLLKTINAHGKNIS
jgi:chitosanase